MFRTRILISAVQTVMASSLFAADAHVEFKLDGDRKKRIQAADISEASGLAISPKSDAFMWIINDSGSTADIHLAGTDGSDRGRLHLKDTRNIDWEDLSSFTLDGISYLLVADTGDNASRRQSCFLYIVREPALPKGAALLSAAALPSWKIEFRYEDGPRDCEAVAVDVKSEKILLLSKRTTPPVLYELPLRAPKKRGISVAKRIGTTSVKAPITRIIPYGDQPTGMDITPDGSLAAVITYHGVFLFPKAKGETWATAFSKDPVKAGAHHLGQAESVGFSSDGKTLFAVAEGKSSPIVRYYRDPGGTDKGLSR